MRFSKKWFISVLKKLGKLSLKLLFLLLIIGVFALHIWLFLEAE